MRIGNSACVAVKFCLPDGAKIPTRFTTISAGAITDSSTSSLSASPDTSVICPTSPSGFSVFALSALRVKIITRAPCLASFSTTERPIKPAPPMTVIVLFFINLDPHHLRCLINRALFYRKARLIVKYHALKYAENILLFRPHNREPVRTQTLSVSHAMIGKRRRGAPLTGDITSIIS